MSFKLSQRSLNRLNGVDNKLIELCEFVIKHTPVDFGIAFLGGFRTPEQQSDLFKAGNSQKDGYKKKSKHQFGDAIDFIPFVDGKVNQERHYFMMVIASFFFAASQLGIEIRSGANWDKDNEWLTDNTFLDLGHLELI